MYKRQQEETRNSGSQRSWDYLYEPDAQSVIDDLLVRYVEALAYQAVAENMASEHSARMVAMQACLLYTSPSPRDRTRPRMPSSA